MDRRQRRTRAAIMSAFTELLTSKDYAHITVQEIIDAADVGRTTFYAHFETKDALLEELCHELFEHVFEEHLQSEPTHDFSRDDSLEARITHVLYHLGDSMDVLGGLLAEGDGSVFIRIFKSYLAELFAAAPAVTGVPEGYALNHLECDFVEAVRWWSKNRSYSPEEICAFFSATSLPRG